MFDGSPDAVSSLGDKLYHKVKVHCRLLDLGYYNIFLKNNICIL